MVDKSVLRLDLNCLEMLCRLYTNRFLYRNKFNSDSRLLHAGNTEGSSVLGRFQSPPTTPPSPPVDGNSRTIARLVCYQGSSLGRMNQVQDWVLLAQTSLELILSHLVPLSSSLEGTHDPWKLSWLKIGPSVEATEGMLRFDFEWPLKWGVNAMTIYRCTPLEGNRICAVRAKISICDVLIFVRSPKI